MSSEAMRPGIAGVTMPGTTERGTCISGSLMRAAARPPRAPPSPLPSSHCPLSTLSPARRVPLPAAAQSSAPAMGRLCLGGGADTAVEPRGERSLEEVVEVAVENALGVALLHGRSEVLHHLVRLQDVGSDLVAPADVGLGVGLRLGRRLALLQLVLVEARAQHVPGLGAVLVLR